MKRYHEVMVTLSESVIKSACSAPLRRTDDDIIYGNTTSLSRKPCLAAKQLLWIAIMKSWSLSNLYRKQQILIQKTYQFINVGNGVSRSHKTTNIFVHLTQ